MLSKFAASASVMICECEAISEPDLQLQSPSFSLCLFSIICLPLDAKVITNKYFFIKGFESISQMLNVTWFKMWKIKFYVFKYWCGQPQFKLGY